MIGKIFLVSLLRAHISMDLSSEVEVPEGKHQGGLYTLTTASVSKVGE